MLTSSHSQSAKWVGLSLLGVLGGCAAFEAAEHVEEVTGLLASSLQAFDTDGDGTVSFDEVCYWFVGANLFTWVEARYRWFGKGGRAVAKGAAKVVGKVRKSSD